MGDAVLAQETPWPAQCIVLSGAGRHGVMGAHRMDGLVEVNDDDGGGIATVVGAPGSANDVTGTYFP